jgi:hypothetical protein
VGFAVAVINLVARVGDRLAGLGQLIAVVAVVVVVVATAREHRDQPESTQQGQLHGLHARVVCAAPAPGNATRCRCDIKPVR